MKHWQELGHIAGRVVRVGVPAALAVVTRIEGSGYRRAGARLLIEGDGAFTGGVSGGCLEEDVRRVGQEVAATGRSRLLHYDTGDDEDTVFGLGLGCNGEVDLMVAPIAGAETRALFARLEPLLAGDEPFALATAVEDGGPAAFAVVGAGGVIAGAGDLEGAGRRALAEGSHREASGGRHLFAEGLRPPPRLLVVGAGDDARPLVAFAAAVGFRVTVVDHRPAFLTVARFPEAQRLVLARGESEVPLGALAVVKTHNLARDRDWVRQLIAADALYLGLLGPRARSERIFAELGLPRGDRVFAPVGLDLGADGPEQVALAVVAELLAVAAGHPGGHLRDRRGAIHG
jgi:xanthine dehydrogenase accessory factor